MQMFECASQPLRNEVDLLVTRRHGLAVRVQEMQRQAAQHAEFDRPVTLGRIEQLGEQLAKLTSPLAEYGRSRASLTHKMEGLQETAAAGFNPLHWFSTERAVAKRELESLQSQHARVTEKWQGVRTQSDKLQADIAKLQARVKQYDAFDAQQISADTARLQAEIKEIEAILPRRQRRLQSLLVELADPNRQIQENLRQISEQSRKIHLARDLNRRLDKAANGYERKMIHEECERAFLGVSKPNVIISQSEREVRILEQTNEKLRRRTEKMAEDAAMDPTTLVLDGSNLCFASGDFIHLTALRPLLESLHCKYKLQVVFDQSATRRLRMSRQEIAAALPWAEVHVMASKMEADELILGLAGDSSDIYVVSNDYYRDYATSSAVREKRLIQFEIMLGTIVIKPLFVKVTCKRLPVAS